MNENDIDHLWKALSDPTRRGILEFLNKNTKTTTEIVEHFPDLTRFNVMKHIDVLRTAELVLTEEDGRKRLNSLNEAKVWLIYENWLSGFDQKEETKEDKPQIELEIKPQRVSQTKKKKDFGWKRYD